MDSVSSSHANLLQDRAKHLVHLSQPFEWTLVTFNKRPFAFGMTLQWSQWFYWTNKACHGITNKILAQSNDYEMRTIYIPKNFFYILRNNIWGFLKILRFLASNGLRHVQRQTCRSIPHEPMTTWKAQTSSAAWNLYTIDSDAINRTIRGRLQIYIKYF